MARLAKIDEESGEMSPLAGSITLSGDEIKECCDILTHNSTTKSAVNALVYYIFGNPIIIKCGDSKSKTSKEIENIVSTRWRNFGIDVLKQFLLYGIAVVAHDEKENMPCVIDLNLLTVSYRHDLKGTRLYTLKWKVRQMSVYSFPDFLNRKNSKKSRLSDITRSIKDFMVFECFPPNTYGSLTSPICGLRGIYRIVNSTLEQGITAIHKMANPEVFTEKVKNILDESKALANVNYAGAESPDREEEAMFETRHLRQEAIDAERANRTVSTVMGGDLPRHSVVDGTNMFSPNWLKRMGMNNIVSLPPGTKLVHQMPSAPPPFFDTVHEILKNEVSMAIGVPVSTFLHTTNARATEINASNEGFGRTAKAHCENLQTVYVDMMYICFGDIAKQLPGTKKQREDKNDNGDPQTDTGDNDESNDKGEFISTIYENYIKECELKSLYSVTFSCSIGRDNTLMLYEQGWMEWDTFKEVMARIMMVPVEFLNNSRELEREAIEIENMIKPSTQSFGKPASSSGKSSSSSSSSGTKPVPTSVTHPMSTKSILKRRKQLDKEDRPQSHFKKGKK